MHPQSASLFDFYEPLPIQVEVADAPLTSDAGLLPLRQFDERIGLTAQFAAALHDPRDPDLIGHTFPEMVRSRVFGILAGYEDQNDHDVLRTDPVFKLIANRSPDDADLASQPTLSRFENERVDTLPVGASLLPRRGKRLAGRQGLFSRHDRGRAPAREERGCSDRNASPDRTGCRIGYQSLTC